LRALDQDEVETLCQKSGAEPANYNGPTQTVIGGPPHAVERASAMAKESGGKVLPVKVSGAFHTSLMKSAAQQFAAAVDTVTVKAPAIPVIGNAKGAPLETADDVAEELKQQIALPVQWYRSMQHILDTGVRSFVELGPGRALSAMLKRIDAEVECTNFDGVEFPAIA
jgi:[acyl-carrier-protein] S-malonyltransferase